MNSRLLTLCLNSALILGFWAISPAPAAHAYSYGSTPIPPEVLYSRELRERIRVPGKVNINTADLNELLTLPGMDENMALKLIRMRPLRTQSDFMKMPFVSPRDIQMLLERLNGHIEF